MRIRNMMAGIFCAVGLLFTPVLARAFGIELVDGRYYWHKDNKKPSASLPQDQGKAAFDRISGPAHATFIGLGQGRDQTLTLDQTGAAQAFALLGRAERVPDDCPSVPCFGYKSSVSADSTVLLLAVDAWSTPGNRVFVAELRSDGKRYEFAEHLQPSPAVNKNIATQSGLRLGLAKDQVKAILGWPQHEEKNSLEYGAVRAQDFTRAEAAARGHEQDYSGAPAGVYRVIHVHFSKDSVDRIWVYHRITWDGVLRPPARQAGAGGRSQEQVPLGNWRIEEVDVRDLQRSYSPPVFRLVPRNDGTLARVKAMGRNPHAFFVRGENVEDPDCDGFIALDYTTRADLRLQRGAVIRIDK